MNTTLYAVVMEFGDCPEEYSREYNGVFDTLDAALAALAELEENASYLGVTNSFIVSFPLNTADYAETIVSI